MVRINLLPREILEKRRWDRWYPYVFVVTAIALVAVAAAWGLLQFSLSQKNNELQTTNETVSQLQSQADSFAIFEQQQQQLEARQKIADSALATRVDMGRLAEEVSLIMPDEVWIGQFTASEAEGITLEAFTPASTEDKSDRSFKSVAKTLVRLASLDQLWDVWLSNANNIHYADFATSGTSGTVAAASSDASIPVVAFTPIAKVRVPQAPAPTNSVPAPPSTTGQ